MVNDSCHLLLRGLSYRVPRANLSSSFTIKYEINCELRDILLYFRGFCLLSLTLINNQRDLTKLQE